LKALGDAAEKPELMPSSTTVSVTLPVTDTAPPRIMGFALTPHNFRYFLWGVQATFWLLWCLLAYHAEPAQRSPVGPFWFVAAHVPIMMGAVYLNYFWLIPRYLARRQYLRYGLAIIWLLGTAQGLRWMVGAYALQESQLFAERWPLSLALSGILLMASTLFKFVEGWFQVSQQQVQLQNEQLRSELRFLRAQVNPHFLFNTLNNLYALTLTQDPRAPQMVAKLSELMRYLIYDSRTTRVKLQRELDLLCSYIELQQLQYDAETNVDFYTEGVKNQHWVAPLLLITFLENSFKHGDLATNPKGWIALSVVVEGRQLRVSVANTTRGTGAASSGGIGLENARRQLLLNYPDRHHLEIIRAEGEFRVDLEIELEAPEAFPPSPVLQPDGARRKKL